MGFATIEINIPGNLWMSELSKKYPDANFTILSCFPLGLTECIICVRIEGKNPKEIADELNSHLSVVETNALLSSEEKAVLTVKTKNTMPLMALLGSEIIVKHPVFIKNGIATLNLIVSPNKLKVMTFLMKAFGFSFKLKRVVSYSEEELFTKRQKKILQLAIKCGYYEIPRRITIRELAEKVGTSKSTLAEILRTVENKMMISGGHVREK